jgi:hypothetical protein
MVAMHQHRDVAGNLRQALRDAVERDQLGPGKLADREFAGLADIQQERRLGGNKLAMGLLDGDLRGWVDMVVGAERGVALQVAA